MAKEAVRLLFWYDILMLKRLTLRGGLLVVIGVAMTTLCSGVAHAAKINISPSNFSLTEGSSRVVQVTLDQPIISSDANPGYVTLNLASNAPGRVSISPSSLTWQFNEWLQSRTFTITAIDDNLRNFDVTPTFTLTTVSNSVFYSGFIPQLTATILDNETDPDPQASEEPPPELPSVLPEVGLGLSNTAIMFAILSAITVGVIQLRSRSKHDN